MKILGIIVFCLLLSSCGTQSTHKRAESFNYEQNIITENWTAEDFKRDHKQCQQDAEQQTVFHMDSRAAEKIYRKCMAERGWRREN